MIHSDYSAFRAPVQPVPFRSNPDWESLARAGLFKPSAVAGLCQVSPRTLQRHFKRSYGCTLGAWLRSYRLEIAYRKLASGEPIKCVALDLGYKQLSHFSRDFKTRYGCAPRFLERTTRTSVAPKELY